jgi:hypothetical protein
MLHLAAIVTCVAFAGGLNTATQVPEHAQATANELVRKVVANELKAETEDRSHWMFRLETERGGRKELDQVVETKEGDLHRPVLVNGRPVSAKEKQDANRRIQKLIHNPEALRKSLREKSEDTARTQRLLKMLPDAFIFSYGERRGELAKLKFTPNPQFRPPSREAQVFHAMEGEMWINIQQERLADITGHLIREVKFGGGLLGHLDKGGQFDVRQEEVVPGYWELTLLNVQMKGKALFFKTIGVQQKTYRSKFRRVPDDLTLLQAADMLRKSAGDANYQ